MGMVLEKSKCIIGEEAGRKLLEDISKVNAEVFVCTAFVDDFGLQILCELVKRGIKTTLITSKNALSNTILNGLLECGVEVYLVKDFVHSKLYLIDDKAYTSSANLTKPALTCSNIEHVCVEDYLTVKRMLLELMSKAEKVKPYYIVKQRLNIKRLQEDITEVSLSGTNIKLALCYDPPRTIVYLNKTPVLISRSVLKGFEKTHYYKCYEDVGLCKRNHALTKLYLRINGYHVEKPEECVKSFKQNGRILNEKAESEITEEFKDLHHIANWVAERLAKKLEEQSIFYKIFEKYVDAQRNKQLKYSVKLHIIIDFQEAKAKLTLGINENAIKKEYGKNLEKLSQSLAKELNIAKENCIKLLSKLTTLNLYNIHTTT